MLFLDIRHYSGKDNFAFEQIINVDDSELSRINSTSREIFSRRSMWVGRKITREIGVNAILVDCIKTLENVVPSALIFSRVHFKIRALNYAPPGTHGDCQPRGWSNMENFIQFLHYFIHHEIRPPQGVSQNLYVDCRNKNNEKITS